MSYLHSSPLTPYLTLHDCPSDQITHTDGILRFRLPDGLWISPEHVANPHGKLLRSDEARVEFALPDLRDGMVWVFERRRGLFGSKTTVSYWTMEQLMEAVNERGAIFEFVTQYNAYGEQMWYGALRSRRRPYYREIQLYLPCTEAICHWNQIRIDREW